MPALDTEDAVVDGLKAYLYDAQAIRCVIPQCAEAEDIERVIAAAKKTATQLDRPSYKRSIISQLLAKVQVHVDRIEITLNPEGLSTLLRQHLDAHIKIPVITASATKVRQGQATKLVLHKDDGTAQKPDLGRTYPPRAHAPGT